MNAKRFALVAAAALLAASSAAPAQTEQPFTPETMNFDMTMALDPVGNIDGKVKFSLTARQFGMWFARYGQNQSLLRRDLSRTLSQYETSDWDVQIRQMDREVTIGFRARGATRYLGDGRFEVRSPKNWKSAGITGQTVNYNYVEAAGPQTLMYAVHVVAPPGATGIAESTADTGEQAITYTLPVAGSGKGWMPVVGAAALLLGLGVVATGFFVRPSATPTATPPAT